MNFKEWLKIELSIKPSHEGYNPDGNSDRAVASRGLFLEILWQYKKYPSRVLSGIKSFEGLETPVGWFIQLPVMIMCAPIFPITAGLHWHKKAVAKFYFDYLKMKRNKAND